MFEVKVTVEIPGLPEAIASLAEALKAKPVTTFTQNGENNHQIENAGTVNIDMADTSAKATAPKENPTAAAPSATSETVSTAAAGPAPIGSPSEKKITLDDIGRAGASLVDAHKMPQLNELLRKYGVQTIVQLKPESYEAVAADLRALGASI